MRPQYLLFASRSGDFAAEAETIAQATGLTVAWSSPPIAALVNPSCSCLAVGDREVVLGTLFHRHGPARAIEKLSEAEISELAGGGFDALLRSYWGGYVAAASAGNMVKVLRDPSGALPCYLGATATASILASDVDLLLAAGAIVDGLDYDTLGRSLLAAGLPMAETALNGIRTLLPGTCIRYDSSGGNIELLWSPWKFAASQELAGEEAVEILRRAVQNCVSGWASTCRRPLVSLSGGLDSSIVAACLAGSCPDALCVSMFTDDPTGDERLFARELCTSLGLPLFECRFMLDAIDIDRALGTHLPRPVGRAQDQAYEDAHLEVARQEGADAFFTGNEGDNVFGYSQSAGAVADRLLLHGVSRGLLRSVADVSRQTGAGPIQVGRAALRLAFGRRGYRWRADPLFLDAEFVAAQRAVFSHPWLDAPPGALPGKAGHIAALVRAQPNLEPGRGRFAPVINPLLSQPVMEVCLAIPSWEWRAGGRDRAVARSAFASNLPASIVERRAKGSPDPFCGEIIRRHRNTIRDRILGGRLAERGMLDLGAIEQALRPDLREEAGGNTRLLELANVEAWIGAWSQRLAGSAARA